MIRNMIRMGIVFRKEGKEGKDWCELSQFLKNFQQNGRQWKQQQFVEQTQQLRNILFKEHKLKKGTMIGVNRKNIATYCHTISNLPYLSQLSISQLIPFLQLSNIVDRFGINNTALRYKLMTKAKMVWEQLDQKGANKQFSNEVNLAFELAIIKVSAKRSLRQNFAKRWLNINDKTKIGEVMWSKLVTIVAAEPLRQKPQYSILMTVLPLFQTLPIESKGLSHYAHLIHRLSQIQEQPFFVNRPLQMQINRIYQRGINLVNMNKLILVGGGKTSSRSYAQILKLVSSKCWSQMKEITQNNRNFTLQEHENMLQNLDRAREYAIREAPLNILTQYLETVPDCALLHMKLLHLLLHGFFDTFLNVFVDFLKKRKQFITLRSLWYLSERGINIFQVEYENQHIPKGEKFLEWAIIYGKTDGKQRTIVLEEIQKWKDDPAQFYKLLKSVSYFPVLQSFHKYFSHLYITQLPNPFDFPLQNQEMKLYLQYLSHTTSLQTLKDTNSKPNLSKFLSQLGLRHKTFLFYLTETLQEQNHFQLKKSFVFQIVRDYFTSPGVSRNPGVIYNVIALLKKIKEVMDVECTSQQINQVVWDILNLFVEDHINIQASIGLFQYIDDFIGIFLWRAISNNYKAENEFMCNLTKNYYHFRSMELKYQIAKKKLKMGWLSAQEAEGIQCLKLDFTENQEKLLQIVIGKEVKLAITSTFSQQQLVLYFSKPQNLPKDINLTNIPDLISTLSAPALQEILIYEQLNSNTHPATSQIHQMLYDRLCDPQLDFQKINCKDLIQTYKRRNNGQYLNGSNIMKAVLNFYEKNTHLFYKSDREIIENYKKEYGL